MAIRTRVCVSLIWLCLSGIAPDSVWAVVAADPQGVVVETEFLSIQVGASGRFNMGANPSAANCGRTAPFTVPCQYNLSFGWPDPVAAYPGYTGFTTVRIVTADPLTGQETIADHGYGDWGLVTPPTASPDGLSITSTEEVGGVRVTQVLAIVRGQSSDRNTARIRYVVTNVDNTPHSVGIRLMIDTSLNGNDGAPFRVQDEAVTVERDYVGSDVPSVFDVFFNLEVADISAQGTLKGGGATSPDRFVIASWLRIQETLFDFSVAAGVPVTSDSTVALYWNPTALGPGASRQMDTFYGPSNGAPLPPTITSGPTSPTSQTSATFAFSDVPSGATPLCDLDGLGFAVCASSTGQSYPGPLAEGAHVFSLKTRDASGHESNVVLFNWTIDPTAPTISFSGVPLDPSDSSSASFSFFTNEASSFTCQLDTLTAEDCQPDPRDPENPTKGSKNYSELGPGEHTFTVTATDAVGNSTSLSFGWVIDLTAPALSITRAPLDPTNSNTASFAFEASEPSTFTCRLDGAMVRPLDPCGPDPSEPDNRAKAAQSYTGLGEGSYTLTVTATDAAAHSVSKQFAWVIDTTEPSVTITTPTNGASFTLNQNVAADYTCSDGLSGVGTCAGPVANGANIDTGSRGQKTFAVTATDEAGNPATVTVRYTVTPPEPTLTVTKVVVGGTKTVGDFPLVVDDREVTSGDQITLTVGRYTVSESTDTSYTAVISGDCAADGTITLAAGAVKSCTITNTFKAVTVTSPDGGETWAIGSTHNITWTSAGLTGRVKVEVSGDGGASPWTSIVASTANDGAHSWKVTGATTQGRIRVTSLTDPTVQDVSNANFTILGIPPQPNLTGDWSNEVIQTCKMVAGRPRCTVKGKFKETNNGTVKAPASKTNFYLSDDPVRGTGDQLLKSSSVGVRPPGKTVTLSLSKALPAGTTGTGKYVIACVDITDVVTESDETEADNCKVSGPIN